MRDGRNTRRWLHRGTMLVGLVLLLIVVTAPLTYATASHSSKHSARNVATRAHLVTVVARDFLFQMPTKIPSGLTEFVFVNHGTQVYLGKDQFLCPEADWYEYYPDGCETIARLLNALRQAIQARPPASAG